MFNLLSNLAIEPEQIKENIFKLFSPSDFFIKPQQYKKINFDISFILPTDKIAKIELNSNYLSQGLVGLSEVIYNQITELSIDVRNIIQIPSINHSFFGNLNCNIKRADCLAYLILF